MDCIVLCMWVVVLCGGREEGNFFFYFLCFFFSVFLSFLVLCFFDPPFWCSSGSHVGAAAHSL